MEIEKRRYGDDLVVADVRADCPGEWDVGDATNVRVSLPVDAKMHAQMLACGYTFADRMYHLRVNLARGGNVYSRLVRTPVELTGGCREEIRGIAHESFPDDRRFHVDVLYNQPKANRILDAWIDEAELFYICRCKGDVAGFLALQDLGGGEELIRLAAVREKYRPAGIATSLYAGVLDACRERGARSVMGYVSSRNLAVLNLYAFLGASFVSVTDVFLKEVPNGVFD